MINLREIHPLRPDFPGRVYGYFNAKLDRPMCLLARLHRATRGRHATLIAVTGSFGKTTTTRAIAAILGQDTHRENLMNCFAGLYRHAMRQTRGRRTAVVEIGIGRDGQMTRYAQTLRPQIAVVTTVGLEHEKFVPGGLDGIAREKSELVAHLSPQCIAVLNRDDPRVFAMAQRTQARVITFGRDPQSDVALVSLQHLGGKGMTLRFRVQQQEYELRTQLVGSVSVGPLLAAIAAAHALGLDLQQACQALAQMTPTSRRLQSVSLPNGAVVLLDEYKNTPSTAHAAYDAVAELPASRRIALLGNIPQSTPEPKEPVYRALGEHAGRVFDRAVLIHLEDEPFQIMRESLVAGGMDDSCISLARDVFAAAELLRSELKEGDVLLIKGHFFDHLSRVLMMLRDQQVRCGLTFCLIRGSDWCDQCPKVLREQS